MENNLKVRTIALKEDVKNMGDSVYNQLATLNNNGVMPIPSNYNMGLALTKANFKILDDSKLMACTNESKVSALLSMATLGLSLDKQQGYFIPMGNKCTFMPSYLGKVACLKRIKGVKNVVADVIYKDTQYELTCDEVGLDTIKIIKPAPLNKRTNDDVVGAWAKVFVNKDIFGFSEFTTIMTIDDIKNSWSMGNANGKSKAHNGFKGEMAKKSALSRLTKNFLSTCDDYFIDELMATSEYDYKDANTNESVQVKPTDISFDNDIIDVADNDIEDNDIDLDISLDMTLNDTI